MFKSGKKVNVNTLPPKLGVKGEYFFGGVKKRSRKTDG
jgi:hypothetical protein